MKLSRTLQHSLWFVRDTIHYWIKENALTASSSISFYVIFALAPLLVTITAVLGLIVGQDFASQAIITELSHHIPASNLDFLRDVFTYQRDHQTSNLIAIIIATVITMITSFSVMYGVKKSLEEFWNPELRMVEHRYKKPLKQLGEFIRERIGSIILLPLLASAFLVSMLLSTTSRIILQFFPSISVTRFIDTSSSVLFPFIIITFLFALMYRYLPDYRMKWSSVIVGAVIAGILFIVGKLFVEYYIANFLTTSQYGAASSLFALMAWIFYSTQVFFVGAASSLVIEKRDLIV